MKSYVFFIGLIVTAPLWAKPSWMNDPSSVCKKSELCAVGMGESRILAASSARAALAKIFSVKVDSKFMLTESSDNQKISSSSFENIIEKTSLDLSGAEITKTHRGDQYDYALARIKKMPFARTLEKQMIDIKEDISRHLNEKHIATVALVRSSLVKWKVLAARREFLVGFRSSAPVTSKKLESLQNELTAGKKFFIRFSGQEKKRVLPFMKDYFSKLGYVVTKSAKKATHFVDILVSSQKANFNVSGFEKYHHTFTLEFSDTKKRSLGTLAIESTKMGRSFRDCLDKAFVVFKNELDQKITQVNLRRI